MLETAPDWWRDLGEREQPMKNWTVEFYNCLGHMSVFTFSCWQAAPAAAAAAALLAAASAAAGSSGSAAGDSVGVGVAAVGGRVT